MAKSLGIDHVELLYLDRRFALYKAGYRWAVQFWDTWIGDREYARAVCLLESMYPQGDESFAHKRIDTNCNETVWGYNMLAFREPGDRHKFMMLLDLSRPEATYE